MQRLLLTSFALLGVFALALGNVYAQTCDVVSIDVTAELSTDPGFEDMYKYTFSGVWETSSPEEGDALSYIMLSLGIECPCLCDSTADVVVFPDPAGTSTGDVEGCEVPYDGFVECLGHEDITDDAVVKFEVTDTGLCEALSYGSGTWVLYSTMAPLPWNEYPGAVFVKHGEMICLGDLIGQLPNCYLCLPTSTEESTWGGVKSLYR